MSSSVSASTEAKRRRHLARAGAHPMIERYDHGHSLRDSSGSEEQINAGRAAAYAGCDSPECRAVRDSIPDLLVGNPGTVQRLGAQAVYAPGTRILVMWVVKGGGVWHAIARRSASIENDHESNDYIDAITQLHVDHPVHRWFVGPANRMTRSQAFVGRLERALVRNGTTVMSDAGAIDVPSTAWNALMMINDITVTETVKGMHGRLIEHVATGLWPKGEVPPGYWRNPQTDLLEVDEGLRVAEMVAAIIDSPHWPGTAHQILDRLGQDYGVPASATFRGKVLAENPRRDPATITIDQVPSADAALRVLWSKLEWYRDGGREHRTSVPDVMRSGIPVAEDGRRVFRGHELENHDGNLEVSGWSPMPLPDGGWATPEAFERSISARDARQARHAVVRTRTRDAASDRKPLSGIGRWGVDGAEGGWEYRLGANRPSAYEVHRRRPTTAGWANDRGELIASVNAVELHRCVAGMILAGCTQGLPLTSVVSTPRLAVNSSTEDLERASLVEQLTRARLAVERAEDAELEAIDDAEAQRYRAAKRRRMIEIDELTVQLEALANPSPPDADSDQVDVLTLAALVAELERDLVQHSPVTGDALREVVADLRVTPTSSLLCLVEMRLRLRTPGGFIETGTLVGKVCNRVRVAKIGNQTASDGRSGELARLYLTGDASVEALASEVGFRPYLVRARIHEWLESRGVPKTHRTALTTCPIPQVRAAIWQHFTGKEVAELDPRFARLIAERYTAPTYTWQQSWVAASLTRREGIAFVATYAPSPDEGVLHTDLCGALGVSSTAGGHHSRIVATSTIAATSRPIVPALERPQPWKASLEADDRRVRLLRCPTCRTRPAWVFLRVPELNTNLVCPECQREPGGSIELPEAYTRPWATVRAGLHVYDTSVVQPDEVVAPNPILIAQTAVARRRRAA